MKYELNRLGADNFEALIQSLVRGIAGIPTLVFGDGPDGQREAVIEEAIFTINDGITTSGRTVVQAKYKSPDGKDEDWDWLRKNLKKELDGFRKREKTHPHIIPKTFLFFTNVGITPVLDTGIRDKAESFVTEYKDIIPNIFILGADDVRTLLENNRDVARCYSSFIMPGDVLSDTIDMLNSIKQRAFENLIEYACQMFREDSAVRLEQAGSLDNKLINIRNVYTDLEAKAWHRANETINGIASYIISLGNDIHIRAQEVFDDSENANLNSFPPKCNIVLIGNAGQGKSTLCQYICQIYRAALIKRFRKNVPDVHSYYSSESSDAITTPLCERFPILINLKRYAAWINKQGDESNYSVLSYIRSLINGKTGGELSIYDLRKFLSGLSWIFIFDGLDEVPASANRSEVLKQIQVFLNKDLVESQCDSLIVCTSRPQGYDDAFSERAYSHYELQNMSKSLCKKYVERLLLNLEANGEIREQYHKTLSDALDDKMVSKLMKTPLYAAIIVLLVKMGGTPPSKRYSLFHDYCEIVIRREQQKEMLPAVNDDYGWINYLHSQIAFLLQAESETRENTAAELSSLRLKEIIEKHLLDEGIEEGLEEKINSLFQAMVKRLSFISEVNGDNCEDCVIFPLRSVQEYFAAEWLISFDDDDKLSEVLEIISLSSYWRNVYLFTAGYFTKNLHRKNINETLFRICLRNNGDTNFANPDEEDTIAWRIGHNGSRLALDLLCDNLFARPADISRYLNLVVELMGSNYNEAQQLTKNLLRLPEKISDRLLRERIVPQLNEKKEANSTEFCFLWAKASQGNEYACECLAQLINIVQSPDLSVMNAVMSYGFSKLPKSVVAKAFYWVTETFFSDYCDYWRTDNAYWDLMSCYYHHFPHEELPVSVVRQLVYQAFINIRQKRSVNDVEFITQRSSFLSEFLLDEHDMVPLYDVTAAESGLKVKSVNIYFESIYFAKYKKLFRLNNLDELVLLIDYLETPSDTTLRQLVMAYKSLPEHYKRGFLRLLGNCDWKLRDVAVYIRESDDVETVIKKYNAILKPLSEKHKKITELAEEGNICEITKCDYWDSVYCDNPACFSEKEVLESLRIANANPFSKGYLNFLINSTKGWDEYPKELKKFYFDNYSKLFETGDGMALALSLFEKTALGELVSKNIQCPKCSPVSWLRTGRGDEQARSIVNKIGFLTKMGGEYLNMYAIIPHLSGRIISCNVEEIVGDVKDMFPAIKRINNSMALLGYVLCALCGPVTENIKEIIREDLVAMLLEKDIYPNWVMTIDAFSFSGILFIYEQLQKIAGEDRYVMDLMGMYARSIRVEVENKPVNKERLVKLAASAHIY